MSYNEYINFWWWVEHAQLSGEYNGMMVWKYEACTSKDTYSQLTLISFRIKRMELHMS